VSAVDKYRPGCVCAQGLVQYAVLWEDGKETWEFRKDLLADGLGEHLKQYSVNSKRGIKGWFSEDYTTTLIAQRVVSSVGSLDKSSDAPQEEAKLATPAKASSTRSSSTGRKGKKQSSKTPAREPTPEKLEPSETLKTTVTDEEDQDGGAPVVTGVATAFGAETRVRFHGSGRILSRSMTMMAGIAVFGYAVATHMGWVGECSCLSWVPWALQALALYHVVYSNAAGEAVSEAHTRTSILFVLLSLLLTPTGETTILDRFLAHAGLPDGLVDAAKWVRVARGLCLLAMANQSQHKAAVRPWHVYMALLVVGFAGWFSHRAEVNAFVSGVTWSPGETLWDTAVALFTLAVTVTLNSVHRVLAHLPEVLHSLAIFVAVVRLAATRSAGSFWGLTSIVLVLHPSWSAAQVKQGLELAELPHTGKIADSIVLFVTWVTFALAAESDEGGVEASGSLQHVDGYDE
jgi:hypothetical protein